MNITIKYAVVGNFPFTLKHKYYGDGGYDLYLQDNVQIMPGETLKIDTGLVLDLPLGLHANIAPRSSTSLKGIVVHNPIIDSNYRGHIHAIITNISNKAYTFKTGERMASLVLLGTHSTDRVELMKVNLSEIDMETERGAKGFGSTNK